MLSYQRKTSRNKSDEEDAYHHWLGEMPALYEDDTTSTAAIADGPRDNPNAAGGTLHFQHSEWRPC